MAQGRANKTKGKSKRKKKAWEPPPRELERLMRVGQQGRLTAAAIREFAGTLVRDLYGEHGPAWGTTFAEIEARHCGIQPLCDDAGQLQRR